MFKTFKNHTPLTTSVIVDLCNSGRIHLTFYLPILLYCLLPLSIQNGIFLTFIVPTWTFSKFCEVLAFNYFYVQYRSN